MSKSAFCPRCHSETDDEYDGEYTCRKCGCVFTEEGEIIDWGD